MARLRNRWGLVIFIAYLFVPGLIAAYLLHSSSWIVIGPGFMLVLMLIVAALPIKRKITPQAWADQLEKHCSARKARTIGMTRLPLYWRTSD
jgi:hypothetical protein